MAHDGQQQAEQKTDIEQLHEVQLPYTVHVYEAKQFPKESAKPFATRDQGIESNCDLKVPCHTCKIPVSYTEDTTYDVVMAGLNDCDLRQLCTAQAFLKSAKNINNLIEFCDAYSNEKLAQAPTVAAPKSTHQRDKKPRNPRTSPTACEYCAGTT